LQYSAEENQTMDDQLFDQLTQQLAALTSRRTALKAVAGGALCTLGARVGIASAADCVALGKKCKKKKDECCGGAECRSLLGLPLPFGRCRCPAGTRPEGGQCVPRDGCVDDSDCAAGQRCCNGTCSTAADYTLAFAWGSPGSGEGEFMHQQHAALAADGTLFVTDVDNDRIQAFTSAGEFVRMWGNEGTEPGQFSRPYGIAVGPDDAVYVTDQFNDRVQVFTQTGAFLRQWGEQGQGNGQFLSPASLAIAPDGTVYVADLGNDRIQAFTPEGVFVTQWGTTGSGEGQFIQPVDTAVASDGTVYVTEFDSNRIQLFSPSGEFLRQWTGTPGGELEQPFGVDIGADGRVYIVDSNSRVQVFTPSGEFVAGTGEGIGATSAEVAPDGTIYVMKENESRIEVYVPTACGAAAGRKAQSDRGKSKQSKVHHGKRGRGKHRNQGKGRRQSHRHR
jgi:hypothetical protein